MIAPRLSATVALLSFALVAGKAGAGPEPSADAAARERACLEGARSDDLLLSSGEWILSHSLIEFGQLDASLSPQYEHLGRRYLSGGCLGRAELLFDRLRAIRERPLAPGDPKVVEVYLAIAQVAFARGDVGRATDLMERARLAVKGSPARGS